ncbi:protein transport protein Sec61 subunit gamma-like [Echinops telfairi]|uniref:Protein transport protein Sec61 subunit gamma-like n=1 Tax=Echinops telfairi TaxID=9371 RepID=A0AC55DL37_ECHTE|nr:protein transport protein Sec61 subunit gamma-like [Echinops telfairi]
MGERDHVSGEPIIMLRDWQASKLGQDPPEGKQDDAMSAGQTEPITHQVLQFVGRRRQFVKDSIRLLRRCTKPDRIEFQKIAMVTAIGFAIMGFIGFFVKLIHIPINNNMVGG